MRNTTYIDAINQGKYSVALKLMINNGDIDDLVSSLKYNELVKTLSQSSGYFLEQAYKSNNLTVAKFLLSYGVNFNIKNFAYIDNNPNKVFFYIKHLHDIKTYLSPDQFDLAFKYIVTIFSSPLSKLTQKECYVVEDVLMNLTHTNDESKANSIKQIYSNLYLHSTPLVHDILKAIAVTNFIKPSLKIYIPFGNSFSCLNSIQTSDNKIYLPMSNLNKDEQGYLIHEIVHYGEDIIAQNSAKPYREDDIDSKNSYYKATKESLANIMPLFNKNKEALLTDEMIKNENVTLRYICSKIADNVPLHLFSFYSNPNPKEQNDKLARVFLNSAGTSDEHKSHFLEHYIKNVINDYNFNNNTIYVLSRMADLCLREDNELEYEPAAFATELEFHGSNITYPLTTFLRNDFLKKIDYLEKNQSIYECNSLDSSHSIISEVEIDIVGEHGT